MEKSIRQSNWKDMEGDLELVLETARGEKRIRRMKFYSREVTADESKMLIRFIFPADVKGTGFLIIEHKDRDDDRYLYLPALRRVKKITASGKGGNFMSSDFTYYDIGRPKLQDWTYKRLPDETVDGHECYTIEALPVNDRIRKDTGYSKIIRWIRKDTFTTYKAIYYDREGKKLKVLTVPQVEKIGGVWFATQMIMHDVQINHKSTMTFKNLRINTGVPERYFTLRYLRRPF